MCWAIVNFAARTNLRTSAWAPSLLSSDADERYAMGYLKAIWKLSEDPLNLVLL